MNSCCGPLSYIVVGGLLMSCIALVGSVALILKKETLDHMWEAVIGSNGRQFDRVGFSWQRRMQGDVQTIFHGGSDGYRSYIIMIPEYDIGFVWMSNTASQPYHEFSQQIADKLIDYRRK